MFHSSKLSFAKMLSDGAGVSLVFDDEAKVSLTIGDDNKYVITMPSLDASLDDSDPRAVWWWGTLCNLLDRVHPETSTLEAQAASIYSVNSIFGQVLARVLATNATKLRFNEYIGKDRWVVAAMEQDAVTYDISLKNNPPNEKNEVALVATNLFDFAAKEVEYGVLSPEYTPLKSKVMDMCSDNVLVNNYLAAKNTLQPCISTAKAILKHLDIDPEEAEEESKEKKKQEGSEGSGKEGACSSEDGDKKSGASMSNTISFKDLPNKEDGEGGTSKESLTIKYDADDLYDSNTYIPAPGGVHVTKSKQTGGNCPYGGDKLSKQVARLLKVKSQSKWEGGKKRGRLRSKSLAKVASDVHYTTPFKKKIDSDVLDTTVLLLVDTSGSMGGSRYAMATESAVKLAGCLSSVHIPTAVAGFTQSWRSHDGGSNKIYIHKEFKEKYSSSNLYNALNSRKSSMGSNDDGISLDWAYEYISKEKQTRKIIIVLSDGQPACSYQAGNPAAYLKQVAGKVERDIDLYAIGIETDSVEHFYSNYKVLNDVSKLEETVLNVVKDQII